MPKPKRKTVLNYKPMSLDDIPDDDDDDDDVENVYEENMEIDRTGSNDTDPTSNSYNNSGSAAAVAQGQTTAARSSLVNNGSNTNNNGAATARPTMINRGKSLTDMMKNYAFDDSSDSSSEDNDDDDTPPAANQKESSTKKDNNNIPFTTITARPGLNRNISAVSFYGTQNLETGSTRSFDSEYTDYTQDISCQQQQQHAAAASSAAVSSAYPRPKFVPSQTKDDSSSAASSSLHGSTPANANPKASLKQHRHTIANDDDSTVSSSMRSLSSTAKEALSRHQRHTVAGSSGSGINWGNSTNIKTGSILHRKQSLEYTRGMASVTSVAVARVAYEDDGSSTTPSTISGFGAGSSSSSKKFTYRPVAGSSVVPPPNATTAAKAAAAPRQVPPAAARAAPPQAESVPTRSTSEESNISSLRTSQRSSMSSVSSLLYPNPNSGNDDGYDGIRVSSAPKSALKTNRNSSATTASSASNKGKDHRLTTMSAMSNMSSTSTVQYPGSREVNSAAAATPQASNRAGANKIKGNQGKGNKKTKKDYTNRLTKISALYDLDGDGVLDEIEQAMRDRDVNGDGQLDTSEVHKIVMERLRNEREVGMYRKVALGLVCLVVVLALSNFGTSWATAILTREVVAEPETGTIQSTKGGTKGEVMGYQEVAHEVDLEPLTDEEFEQRRRLVEEEMAEDAEHEDHIHRRLGKKNDQHACGCTKIAHDHGKIPERELHSLIQKCDGVNTVTLKRKWKNGDFDLDTICGPGTVVVKKGKKKRNKSKTKVKVVEEQIKFRRKGGGKKKGKNKGGGSRDEVYDQEVSFSCQGGYCFGSGATLLQQEGHPCDLSRDRDGAGECDDGLICYDPDGDRYGTGTCIQIEKFSRKNQVCDLDYGVDACEVGYGCYSSVIKRSRNVGVVNTGTCQKVVQRVANQNVCNASYGTEACEEGFSCIGENGRELNGWGVGYCQRLVVKQRSGGLCDLALGRDACDEGFYCRDSMLVRSGNSGGGGNNNGYEGYGMTNAIISGPSGTIITGSGNRARGNLQARSTGTGLCTRTVGRGGRCESNEECGWKGTCVGLGADTATGGVIRGASGTIVWGTGGATTGICG